METGIRQSWFDFLWKFSCYHYKIVFFLFLWSISDTYRSWFLCCWCLGVSDPKELVVAFSSLDTSTQGRHVNATLRFWSFIWIDFIVIVACMVIVKVMLMNTDTLLMPSSEFSWLVEEQAVKVRKQDWGLTP